MRIDPGRTKKLIVAFQFQFANQAAWKCDTCRNNRLEKTRRCGFQPESNAGPVQVVWARRDVVSRECPVSYITATSWRWIEEYAAWKAAGKGNLQQLPARTFDAFHVIEQQIQRELSHAETSVRK